MKTHKPLIITRWERSTEPYTDERFGRLEIELKPPSRGDGWQRVRVDVTTSDLKYLSREEW